MPLADVYWIEASGNYSRVHVKKRAHLVTKTLAALVRGGLDPDVFVRVHRSVIVNRRRISTIESLRRGDANLVLCDGTNVPCSRRYREELRRRIPCFV